MIIASGSPWTWLMVLPGFLEYKALVIRKMPEDITMSSQDEVYLSPGFLEFKPPMIRKMPEEHRSC
jgi:hypothetical protein